MAYLLSYTREPIDNVLYDPRLAYSMHLAISDDLVVFTPLNHNSGILFPKATENSDGSLNPKTIKKPVLFKDEQGYGVFAQRAGADGEEEKPEKVLVFRTTDFVDYEELPVVEKNDAFVSELSKHVNRRLPRINFNIQGIVPENIIEIEDELADYLKKKFITAVNTEIVVPSDIYVSSKEELEKVKVSAVYSDGTTADKCVDWDCSSVDFSKPGKATIKGKIRQNHFPFPVATHRADPCIGKWEGKYYFISTYDADHEHSIFVREADSIEGLVTAEDHLILDTETYDDIKGLLWAPEFHIIDGKMYIFHAATVGPFFNEESHVMALKEGGNICNREDWSRPMRVKKADGSDICEAGKEITLDMTEFEWEGEHYAIWSQRQFLPKDLGAWLYIAKINPKEPWKLMTDPIVLSKPDYGWGNNHTFVEEGPFALLRDDKLFITFSAAAVDTSYVVGLLSIEKGKDLLDISSWKKKGYPILTSRSVEGEYGTGHNAFVQDENGDIWNTYHGRPGTEAPRSSGIRRVHFDIDSEPVLDMTEEMDVRPDLKEVTMTIEIK